LLLALVVAAFAAGYLPFSTKPPSREANSAAEAKSPVSTGSMAVRPVEHADPAVTSRLNQPIGYAGVTRPTALTSPPPPLNNNGVANQPRGPFKDPRMQNPNGSGMYGPPPPPPPPGQPMSQFGNGPGAGAPPDGRFPPPPPPPPGSGQGRPMFGPPPNPNGPRP
jgi:hypothetical protein